MSAVTSPVMRVRVTELLKERGWTGYRLAIAAKERGVSEQAIYRLVRLKGRQSRFDARLLDVLCDIFDVDPSELLEHERPKRR